MSYVVINAITVPQEGREEFERRFANRAGEVSKAEGFQFFELLRPADEATGDKYLVLTKWDSKDNFLGWMKSAAFTRGHKSHEGSGPVGTASEVWSYEVIQEEGG